MLKQLLLLALTLAMAAPATPLELATPLPLDLKPDRQQAEAAHLTADLLARYHYRAKPLDAALSEKIFDHYLKSLDADKMFFVQPDIDRLAGIRTRLADAILGEDLDIPFVIFNFFTQRVADRVAYARALLKQGFDFRENETYQYARETVPWQQSEEEMRDLWRKRVKNDWLRLKLAGKDDSSIAETLDRRYENSLKHVGRLNSQDAFQTFMNAYTTAIEPHTSYMGPRAADDYAIFARISLVGIGVVLAEKDDYTAIREITPGGPAALSGQLKIGDRIIGIAQDQDGPMTDIQGWRMDDTVALIRGAADSVVVLEVLPAHAGPDDKRKLVSLTRKKIVLEDQIARKSILSVKDENVTRHIGVISLPTFYHDFEARQKGDKDFKSASRDVERLLAECRREDLDAVLIDLRNNGGGSMAEAIDLTGLFIGKGPVVQERDARGEVTVENGSRAEPAWSGALGVLINRRSASASEIFAAAIQDYGRGLVIGETSYGKGTVQHIVSLDLLAKNDQPRFGELKLTVAQFFRIDGSTTQLRGVTPDIPFPAAADVEYFGESSLDNALPWLQIKPVDYATTGDLKSLLPVLLTRHEARVTIDQDFKYIKQDIAEFQLQRRRSRVSLNEAERRQERDDLETRMLSRLARGNAGQEPAQSRKGVILDDGLQADERKLDNQLAAEKVRKAAKDILLSEAVRILSDAVAASCASGRTNPTSGFPLVDSKSRHPPIFSGSSSEQYFDHCDRGNRSTDQTTPSRTAWPSPPQ